MLPKRGRGTNHFTISRRPAGAMSNFCPAMRTKTAGGGDVDFLDALPIDPLSAFRYEQVGYNLINHENEVFRRCRLPCRLPLFRVNQKLMRSAKRSCRSPPSTLLLLLSPLVMVMKPPVDTFEPGL